MTSSRRVLAAHLRVPDERARLREAREPAAPRRLAAPPTALDAADLLIVNTCSIRDKAEHRLYSDLGVLRAWKQASPGPPARRRRLRRAAGGRRAAAALPAGRLRLRHAQPALGARRWSRRRAAATRAARTQESSGRERFDLPDRHPDLRAGDAGPRLRHGDGGLRPVLQLLHRAAHARPRDQPAGGGDPARGGAARRARRARDHAARPDRERLRPPRPAARPARPRERSASPRCSRGSPTIPGLARIRYTSPHPAFFDDALIRAHARAAGALPARAPAAAERLGRGARAHAPPLPRATTTARLVERLREARPDLALTTDLIVGFPGETDRGLRGDPRARARGRLRRRLHRSSTRRARGRPRRATRTRCRPSVAQARLEALQQLQRELTLAAHRARVGRAHRGAGRGAEPARGRARAPGATRTTGW